MPADPSKRDFFISYTGVDEPWAEWIAVELERAGYTTVLQAFDFPPGSDFVHEMQLAVRTVTRTIAVLSPAYFESAMSESEWRSVFADDPSGESRRLVPVRVERFDDPGLLKTRVYIDLVGLDEPTAVQELLKGVAVDRPRPTTAAFPGLLAQPPEPFPGSGSAASSLGALTALRTEIQSISDSAEAQGWESKTTDTTLRLWTHRGKRLTFSIGEPVATRAQLRSFTRELRANGLRVNRSIRVPPDQGPILTS